MTAGGIARLGAGGEELPISVPPCAGEEDDRAEAACYVFDWRASRSSECAGILWARGVAESGAENSSQVRVMVRCLL